MCLSGPDGALTREVARGLAERLGFLSVDEEIILRAAAEAGVEPGAIEDVERRRSLIDRALASARTTAITGSGDTGPGGVDSFYTGSVAASPAYGGAGLGDFIRAAVEEAADRGSVVIVGHAASHALAERPDVLRVLVTASRATRQARIASEQNLTSDTAARTLDSSDAARADYLSRFYGAKNELPTQYDIVLNTDRLSSGEVVSLVAFAASS